MPTEPEQQPVEPKIEKKHSRLAHLKDFFWDPNPELSPRFKSEQEWADEFIPQYLNGSHLTEAKDEADFIYDHLLLEFEYIDASQDLLREKCNELLRLNTGLIIALVAFFQYLDASVRPYSAFSAFLFFAPVLVMLRCLTGLPWSSPTGSKEMTKWARKHHDSLNRVKLLAVARSQRALARNRYVNNWVARRLTFGWCLTLIGLAILCLAAYVGVVFHSSPS